MRAHKSFSTARKGACATCAARLAYILDARRTILRAPHRRPSVHLCFRDAERSSHGRTIELPPPRGLSELLLDRVVRGIALALAFTLLIPVAAVAQTAADADRDAPYLGKVVPTPVEEGGWEQPSRIPFPVARPSTASDASAHPGSEIAIPVVVLDEGAPDALTIAWSVLNSESYCSFKLAVPYQEVPDPPLDVTCTGKSASVNIKKITMEDGEEAYQATFCVTDGECTGVHGEMTIYLKSTGEVCGSVTVPLKKD